VADWQWIGAAALRRAVRDTPASLTAWFPIVFRHIEESVTRQPTLFPAMVQQLWKT
jgi:isopentenyldiphosphate isomerase